MISDAEFLAGLTGRAENLARIAEAHPHTLNLIPSGLIPEVDEIRKLKE